MSDIQSRKISNELMDKERWALILQRFVSILRINVFVVDSQGRPFLTSHVRGCGWRFWLHSPIGSEMLLGGGQWLTRFVKNGEYLEYKDPFELCTFAIPLGPAGYIIVGPVVFNKRLENSEYWEIARETGSNFEDMIEEIDEIRVISFLDIHAILGILEEVFGYAVELKLKIREAREARFKALLDVALGLARVECGSVMLLDRDAGELKLTASRGRETAPHKDVRLRLGEGISGLAAQENRTFVIQGEDSSDNRIKPLLKRPEIQHALVMPLTEQNRVIGVLNLHTTSREKSTLQETIPALETLFKTSDL
jgi:putative methionine-R-sulfoxide reductase with GAF domain